MESSKRIVLNTIVQHLRSIINICLSLYSIRLVFQALGETDYGIYSLVAGIVAMLAFITNAMVITTQRQLSYYHGKGDMLQVRAMFSNSLFIHVLLSVVAVVIMLTLTPYIFDSFLDIDANRIPTAVKVYYMVVITLVITFMTSPYRALFVAHEEITYISVVDIVDGVLKLVFALCLQYISYDRLLAYSIAIAGIMAFNFLALSIWGVYHFTEATFIPQFELIHRKYLKEVAGFATWTVYSTGCVMARTQGVNVISNRFFGTVVNSSYGIALQILNSISFIGQAVINAFSPQIVKAEGAGCRRQMLQGSEQASKYAFLLLAVVIIPLTFEMPMVLEFWLGDIPPHAVTLCRFMIVASLLDRLTIGLVTANQAIGQIRNFTLLINTIKLLTLPFFWLCLYWGYSIEGAMWIYLGFEFLCALIRLPYMSLTSGLSIRHYITHVFCRVVPPVVCISAGCFLTVMYVDIPLRFLLTGTLSVVIAGCSIWFFSLENNEKQKVKQWYIQILNRKYK